MIRTILIASLLGVLPYSAEARQFRQFNAINAPAEVPEGATAVQVVQPVPRSVVEQGVKQITESWNSGNITNELAEEFYDAQRLQDNIQSFAPRDAKLRVLSVRGHQVLQQYELDEKRVSRVSVTVGTQVEFNSPQQGFQTRQGTSELILKITEQAGI